MCRLEKKSRLIFGSIRIYPAKATLIFLAKRKLRYLDGLTRLHKVT